MGVVSDSPQIWIAGRPINKVARLFKFHGCLGLPASLRYTFNSVGRGFPGEVRYKLAEYCQQKILLIGDSSADSDMLEIYGRGKIFGD